MRETLPTCCLRDGEHDVIQGDSIVSQPFSSLTSPLGGPQVFVQTERLEWFPIRVAYSREMKVKAYLDSLNIENFIPMNYIDGKGIHKGKRRLVPVIHNLLFVRSTREVLDSLKRSNSVAVNMRYIMDKGVNLPIVVPDDQMCNFIAVSCTYDEQLIYLDEETVKFKIGDRIRVVDGLFKGVEGELIRIKGDRRLVVKLEGFMAVAMGFIHPKYLEKIETISE